MTSPGIGGYPELKKPATRAMQGYRGVWFALLEIVPRHLRTVQHVRNGLRSLHQRRA